MALVVPPTTWTVAEVEQLRQTYVETKRDALLQQCDLSIQEHCQMVILQALVYTHTREQLKEITMQLFETMKDSIKEPVKRLLHARQGLFVSYATVVARMSAVFMAHGFDVWLAYTEGEEQYRASVQLLLRAVEKHWVDLAPFVQEMSEAVKALRDALVDLACNAKEGPDKARLVEQLWEDREFWRGKFSEADQKYRGNCVMAEFLPSKQASKQDRIAFVEQRIRDNRAQEASLRAKLSQLQQRARADVEHHKVESGETGTERFFFGLFAWHTSARSRDERHEEHTVDTQQSQALCKQSLAEVEADHQQLCQLKERLIQGMEDDKVAVERVAEIFKENMESTRLRYFEASQAYNAAKDSYTTTLVANAGLPPEEAHRIEKIVNHLAAFAEHILPQIDTMDTAKDTVRAIAGARPSLARLTNAIMPLADCTILNDIISAMNVGKARDPSVCGFFRGVQTLLCELVLPRSTAAALPSPPAAAAALPPPSAAVSSSSSSASEEAPSSATAAAAAPTACPCPAPLQLPAPAQGGVAAVDDFTRTVYQPRRFLF